MTPQTLQRIRQEIRHQRALLGVEQTWAGTQPAGPVRDEVFRRVMMLERMLRLNEAVVTAYEATRVDGESSQDTRRRFWTTVVAVAERELSQFTVHR